MAAYRRSPLSFFTASLVAGLTMVTLQGTASSSTPSLLWTGARTVAVHCLVQSTTTPNPVEFERALCNRVRALASDRARLPVTIVEAGDPAFIRGDAVILLVHASVQRTPAGQMIAFAIRPYRPSGGDAEVYFGAAPKALLAETGLIGPALDSQIRVALGEILPARDPAGGAHRPL